MSKIIPSFHARCASLTLSLVLVLLVTSCRPITPSRPASDTTTALEVLASDVTDAVASDLPMLPGDLITADSSTVPADTANLADGQDGTALLPDVPATNPPGGVEGNLPFLLSAGQHVKSTNYRLKVTLTPTHPLGVGKSSNYRIVLGHPGGE